VKRLLLIAYFFPPLSGGGVSRTVGLVRYLPEYGWEPVLLTVDDPGYPLQDKERLADLPPGLPIGRAEPSRLSRLRRLAGGPVGGGGRRSGRTHSILRGLADWFLLPDPYLGWALPAYRAGRELIDRYRPDAIMSTSPPLTSHLVGMALAGKSGLPWLADFRDPWTNWMSLGAPTSLHRALQATLERRVLRRADDVTAVHPGFFTASTGLPDGFSTVHIPGGYDPALAVSRPGGESKGEEEGAFRLVFTGSLTRKVRAVEFLTGLARLPGIRTGEDVDHLRVEFYGFRDAENEGPVARLGLERVVGFHDPVSYREALSIQAGADALLLLLPEAPGIETCYAGKLFEYLVSGRPILAVVPKRSAAARLIEELDAGTVVEPGSPDKIAAALKNMMAGRGEFDPPGPEKLAPFNLKLLAEKLAGTLDRLGQN
jgi:glycosyltransferase involved in cell wall biosynthesis